MVLDIARLTAWSMARLVSGLKERMVLRQRHRLLVKVEIEMRQEGKDSFVATCPQLGCIFVHEETEEAAYSHAREAIDAYMFASLEHGDPIPESVVVSHEVTDAPSRPQTLQKVAPKRELALSSTYDVAVSA